MWTPRGLRREGPRYLALADRIAEDVTSGRLAPGVQLPPVRQLATRLGVDLATVTRAYREAARRGLLAGHVGRGTFVRPALAAGAAGPGLGEAVGVVDLSLNLPPRLAGDLAARALRETLAAVGAEDDPARLLTYHQNAGDEPHRAAGAMWIAARGLEAPAGRVVVTSGAQHALATVLLALLEPGDVVATEALTYPGFRALADHLHLQVAGLPLDELGIRPDALRALCRERPVKALYCTPTLHNPTAAVSPAARRRELAAVAEECGIAIIEDDVYGALVSDAPPPIAALAPTRTWFVASLSKAVAPGLRIGYVLAPGAREADRLAAAVRATTWMAPPLTADVAARWIRDGTARRLLAAHRAEAVARQALARRLLGGWDWRAHPEGYHGWLALPAPWSTAEFVAQARRAGVTVTPRGAFEVSTDAPAAGVRISVSAAADTESLGRALGRLARLLELGPDGAAPII